MDNGSPDRRPVIKCSEENFDDDMISVDGEID